MEARSITPKEPTTAMSTSYEKASKELVRYFIGLVLFETILISASIVVFNFLQQSPEAYDLLPFGKLAVCTLGAVPIVVLILKMVQLQELFWKESAEQFGFAYLRKPWFERDALILREGHSGMTGHGMQGMLGDDPVRLYQYSYATGYAKSRESRTYIILEVIFSGTFPHLYLNNIRNRNLSGLTSLSLPTVPLPYEFDGKFKLYAPEGYEIEALEIFTPDILAHMLDEKWEHDIELVDRKLYIFREQSISNREQIELEFNRLRGILHYLAPTLNRVKLAPIGDLKHTL